MTAPAPAPAPERASDIVQRVIAALLSVLIVLGCAVFKQTGDLGSSIDRLRDSVAELTAQTRAQRAELTNLLRRVDRLEAKHDAAR